MNFKTTIPSFFIFAFLSSMQLFAQNTRFSWAKGIGGANEDRLEAIASDASGNVYTIGYFKDTTDFDPGPGVLNLMSAGKSDIFISKLDPNGNFIWVQKIGGVGEDWAHEINIDTAGYLYITGEFEGTVDFNPGPGVSNLTSSGLLDIFIAKLDTSGNLIWAKQVGGVSSYDYGTSITADLSGNVYVSGYFWGGVADFDPGPMVYNLTSDVSYFDAYILKLDSGGNFSWAKMIGGNGHDWAKKITVDFEGNVYATGEFQVTVDFNPGTGINNLTASGASDIFVLKLNTKGIFHWARKMGGAGWDEGEAITVDLYGNVYSTGRFVQTVDFDPGAGVYNLTGNSIDAYISKLDKNGDFVWAKQIGGRLADLGNGIKTDNVGNVYTTGGFVEKVDFDPGPDSSFIDAGVYNRNGFISKLDTGGNFIWAEGLGGKSFNYGCLITLDHSGSIIAAGGFADTGDFNPEPPVVELMSKAGSVDVFIVKLGSCASNATITVSACDRFVSPSTQYTWTTSGIYKDTIPNTAGCDSIITVNLTILYSSASMMAAKVCNQFVSPSLKHTWTVSGDYTDTIPNSVGCDSIIFINLTVEIGNVTITHNSSTLTANVDVDSVTYQWLDCTAAYAPITSQKGRHFIPTLNGNYAVVVTKNGCADTSDCVNMTTVGLNENELMGYVDIYPNPTTGQLTIDLGSTHKTIQVKVSNIVGQELVNETFEQKDKLQLTIPGEAGLYFIELTDAHNHKVCLKVIKH